MNPLHRRGLLLGAAGLVAMPAIVRASSLMPITGRQAVGPQETFWVEGYDADGNRLRQLVTVSPTSGRLMDGIAALVSSGAGFTPCRVGLLAIGNESRIPVRV
jgi:hypothetical protein